MIEQELQKAISFIRAGETQPARNLLAQILKQDPDHEQAWMWISQCYEEPERKRYCFERVLKKNPQNQAARKALDALRPGNSPNIRSNTSSNTSSNSTPGTTTTPAGGMTVSQLDAMRSEALPPETLQLRQSQGDARPDTGAQSVVVQPDAPQVAARRKADKPRRRVTAEVGPTNKISNRLESHKLSGILSFLLSLLIVAVVAGAVWAGLSYMLPDDIPILHGQVKSHLTGIGVFCSAIEPAEGGTDYAYVMRCNGYPADGRVQVTVDIYSEKDPLKVDLILAYATQLRGDPTAAEMGSLLAHVAALPYKNANPTQASTWVQQNFAMVQDVQTAENQETQFGRVRFHLASLNSSKKYLAIGKGQN